MLLKFFLSDVRCVVRLLEQNLFTIVPQLESYLLAINLLVTKAVIYVDSSNFELPLWFLKITSAFSQIVIFHQLKTPFEHCNFSFILLTFSSLVIILLVEIRPSHDSDFLKVNILFLVCLLRQTFLWHYPIYTIL